MFKPNLTEDQQNALIELASILPEKMTKVESYTFNKIKILHNKLAELNANIEKSKSMINEMEGAAIKTIGEYEAVADGYLELRDDNNNTEDKND